MANRPDEARIEFHIRESTSPESVSARLGERLRVGDIVRVAGPLGTLLSAREGRRARDRDRRRQRHGTDPVHRLDASSQGPAQSGARLFRRARRAGRVRRGRDAAAGWKASRIPRRTWSCRTAQAGTERRTGLITDAVDQDFERLDGFKAYLAGPPAMVEAARGAADAQGRGGARHSCRCVLSGACCRGGEGGGVSGCLSLPAASAGPLLRQRGPPSRPSPGTAGGRGVRPLPRLCRGRVRVGARGRPALKTRVHPSPTVRNRQHDPARKPRSARHRRCARHRPRDRADAARARGRGVDRRQRCVHRRRRTRSRGR